MATHYPGLGNNSSPLPSNDPVIPSDLIPGHVMDQIRNVLTTEQMRVLASESTKQQFTGVVEKMMTEMVADALRDLEITPQGAERVAQLAAAMKEADLRTSTGGGAQPPASAPAPAPASDSSQPPPGGGGDEPPVVVPGRGADQGRMPQEEVKSFKQAYQEGRAVTMSSLGRTVAGAAATFTSRHSPNWKEEFDEEGNRTGRLVQYEYDAAGNPVESEVLDPGEPGYVSTLKNVRRGQIASATLTGLASGKGVAGSAAGLSSMGGAAGTVGRLGMMATRVAGPVGIGVGLVSAAGNTLESQFAKGAGYREAFGEQGTGFFSAEDRLGEWWAGMQGFGTIGGERAREQYKAASALGLRGQGRDSATDFASDMWMSLGMSTQESMQVVRQSIEDGGISLLEYADTLREVSRAAVESGRSSKEAVADFISARKIVSSNLARGDTATEITAGLADMAAGMNVETLNALGGVEGLSRIASSREMLYTSAAMTGQNPLAARANIAAGGQTAQNQVNAQIGGGANAVITQMAAVMGVPEDRLRADAKAAASGNGVVTDADQNRLWMEWAGDDEARAGSNYASLQMILPVYGFPASQNDQDNRNVFFGMLTGQLEQEMKKEGGGGGAGTVSGHKSTAEFGRKGGQMLSYKKGDLKANQRAYLRGDSNAPGKMSLAEATYLEEVVTKTGKGDRAIEELLENKTQKEIADFAGTDVSDLKYRVKDSKGKSKDLSLEEVMESKRYRAQLTSGKAKVKGEGSNEWRSVSEFTDAGEDGGKAPKGDAAPKQEVLVKFTGEAARFFKVTGPTDAERGGYPESGILDPSLVMPYGSQ